MTDIERLLIRLRGAGEIEAVEEIERLTKVVDALTAGLNKVLHDHRLEEALLNERMDGLEHRLDAMRGMVERLRFNREGN